MKKNILIIVFFIQVVFVHISFSQLLYVQSNNTQTENVKKILINSNSEIQTKLSQFSSILAQSNYPNTKIQIVYFDPYIIGSLELKEKNNLTPNLYVQNWKNSLNSNDEKILFLFYKGNKTDGTYTFCKLAVSDYLEENHLFPEVIDYITDEIMLKEQNELLIIKKGINGLKNAFDDYFKDKLIEGANLQIAESKYYKGSCYIPFYWFNFVGLYNRNLVDPRLNCYLLKLDSDNNKVPFVEYGNQYKLWKFFEFDYGQNLSQEYAQTIFIDTVPQITLFDAMSSIQYDRDYIKLKNDSIGSCPTYTSLDDFPSNLYAFTVLDGLKSSLKNTPFYFTVPENKTINLDYILELERYKFSQHLYYGKVAQGEQFSRFKGRFVYPSFTNYQATWCNVFASDLSMYIYGMVNAKRAIPSGKNANTLNDYFNNNQVNYIEVVGNPWKYINSGYMVIFSKTAGIGHIEIGYPDPCNNPNFLNEGQKKYWEDITQYNNNSSINSICVGAGSRVGYKTTTTNRNWANSAQKFLYLEYLKKEFNH